MVHGIALHRTGANLHLHEDAVSRQRTDNKNLVALSNTQMAGFRTLVMLQNPHPTTISFLFFSSFLSSEKLGFSYSSFLNSEYKFPPKLFGLQIASKIYLPFFILMELEPEMAILIP